jgi:uncharacterized protein/uncharacterized protein DUF2163
MKNLSADLLALLASGVPCEVSTLFAIGPCDNGAMIYATNAQLPVVLGGNRYEAAKFGSWSRGEITVKIGLESNSCQLTVLADNQVPIYFPGTDNGALLLDGIKFGLLGDADVTISALYNSPYLAGYAFPNVLGPTGGSLIEPKFVGQVANVPQIGMTKALIDVQDMMYLLNIQVPHRVIQASCSHTLYDVGCTLSAATFTKTGAVAAVTYPYLFGTTAELAVVAAGGTFAQGVLTWTSGKNTGLSSFVRAWTAGGYDSGAGDLIQLDVQPIFPIAVSDAFAITQGCNKTFAMCAILQPSSTAAYTNFGGQPDTPVPETAIG